MKDDLQHGLLRECAASGQMDASQIHQHLRSGELDPADFTAVQSGLHALERQIAVDACRCDIETKAKLVEVREGPINLYDVGQLEPSIIRDAELLQADQRDVARAVVYLDLLGLLQRHDAGKAHIVSIREVAA